jgi:hypothetical protein
MVLEPASLAIPLALCLGVAMLVVWLVRRFARR